MKQRHTLERLEIKVQVELHQDAEDSFVATCPQLGCIFVHEETESAAIHYVREAIDAFVETALEHNDPIPKAVIVSRTVIEVESSEHAPSPARLPVAELDLTSRYDVAVPA